MKIFVSGKIGVDKSVQEVMALIRASGHEITFDWTQIDHLRPYEENSHLSAEAAQLEIDGVRRADILLLLSHERGVGMFVELGAALALNKQVIVVETPPARTMFFFHPLVRRVARVNDAIALMGDAKQ